LFADCKLNVALETTSS